MTALLVAALLAQSDVPPDAAGTWADPSRSVFLLPGSRSLSSGFGPVSLDGLQPAASAVTFDGLTLRSPAHGFFGPSIVQPGFVEGVRVGDAAGSVETGRTLGRSVTLLPAASTGDEWRGRLRLDVLALSASGSGRVPGLKTQVDVGARFFGLPALAASFLRVRALLGDWHLRVAQPLGSGELRVLGLGAVDDVALTVSGIPLAARLSTQTADVRWRSDAAGTIELGLTGNLDSIALAIRGEQTRHDVIGGEQAVSARLAVRPSLGGGVRLGLGADGTARRLVLDRVSDSGLAGVGGTPGRFVTASSSRALGVALAGGLFVEARDDEGPFRWSVGLRGDVWKPIGGETFGSLEPRLSLARDFGDRWTVSASGGLRHQPASWLVPVPVLDTASWRFGLQQAVVGDVQATYRPAAEHRFETRFFGTSLRRSLELSPFDDTFLPQVNLSPQDVERRLGDGWAAGASLAWAFQPSAQAWLRASYSFVTSWRTITFSRVGSDGLPTGEARASVPWSFDLAHVLQASGGWRFGAGWALAASIALQSGAPLAGGLWGQEQRPGVDSLRGTPRWVPVDRDLVGRASPWLRVDLRASKTWRPGALEVELFLDVQNASVWAQPTGTSYGTAPASLEQQARGDVTLTSRPASAPLGFPIPVLGVELRR
ncbi:MAG: hypothetical protein MUC96_26620 [Myxococcaceae bacterium]|nr:hypothetical protein [Myxococcaceae bacterium]